MKRKWNLLPLAGFLVSLVAFLSYFFFFALFPVTRDFPWANLLLFAVALAVLARGLKRAYRQPELYRGKISGPVLAVLSVAALGLFLFYNFSFSKQLPGSKQAPRVGQKAPDFTLPDKDSRPVTLAKLWEGDAEIGRPGGWVLLVFYRGYW